MKYIRLIPAVSSAAATTFSLFYVMQSLVASDEVIVPDTPAYHTIIEWEVPPTKPPRDMDRFKPKKLVFHNPPPSNPRPPIAKPSPTTFIVPTAPVKPPQTGDGFTPTAHDGERMPLVRVAPQYPRRCADRGLSGWVVLEFDVNKYGAVENPTVLDHDGSGCFNRTALKTIARFKYKPTVVDGQARPSSNVRFRMSFSMEG